MSFHLFHSIDFSFQYGIEKRVDPDEEEDEDEDDEEFGTSAKKDDQPEDPVARKDL